MVDSFLPDTFPDTSDPGGRPSPHGMALSAAPLSPAPAAVLP